MTDDQIITSSRTALAILPPLAADLLNRAEAHDTKSMYEIGRLLHEKAGNDNTLKERIRPGNGQ